MTELKSKIDENERLHKDIFTLKQAHQRDVIELEALLSKQQQRDVALRSDLESKRSCITGLADERSSMRVKYEEKCAEVEQIRYVHNLAPPRVSFAPVP